MSKLMDGESVPSPKHTFELPVYCLQVLWPLNCLGGFDPGLSGAGTCAVRHFWFLRAMLGA